MTKKCSYCGKEYNFDFKGLINPNSPILHYCENCIEEGNNDLDRNIFVKRLEKLIKKEKNIIL